MVVKKYFVMFVILLMTLSSLAIIDLSVKPAQAAPFRNLTVQSTPIVGINFTINGAPYTTNTTVILDIDPSDVFTVSMPLTWMNGSDQYTFMRWENGSTKPVRVVSLTSDKTIIAFYAHIKVYVDQPGGYIPGVPVGDTITVDIMMVTSGYNDFGTPSICGWALDLQVDPDVISINTTAPSPPPFPPPPPDATVIGSEAGYIMYDYNQLLGNPHPPSLLPGGANATTGFWDDITEIFVPLPSTGFGDYMTNTYYGGPAPLVTINMTSKSETAYSPIDLFEVEWIDGTNTWHPVDEVIHGHYNEYIPHNLTVQSTPIDGINFTAPRHAYDVTTYTTNTTVELQENKSYTVTMPLKWMNNTDQYNFVKWEDTSTNPVRVVSLTSDMTIIATYERVLKNYTLNVNSEPITGVSFTIDSTTNTTNTQLILWEGSYTVTMPYAWMNNTARYIFRHWEDNSTNRQRTVVLASNTTINATYGLAKNYTLTVNSVPITDVNFTIGSKTYATNASVILLEGPRTVTMPSTWMNGTNRYVFRQWENSSPNRQRTISLASNTTITATYEPTYVKVYVNQSLGYIPGVPVNDTVTVDIIIEVTNITDNSPEGITGWSMDVQVNPDVLNITPAIGAGPGYFLWEFANSYSYAAPSLDSILNATAGFGNITEFLLGLPNGAGDPWSGYKLVTLEFTSKSETAYSIIDLINVNYMTADGNWHPVDEIVGGYYNQVPFLTVESTPIDGINFTIDTTTYTTNTSVILPKGITVSMPSTWMVGADQYSFVEWEDTSTNPVRYISLTSNMTIIATYERVLKNYTLTVNSLPITGVNFTIGAETYATNTSIILLEGSYTVSMPSTWMVGADQYSFVEWEDTSTNPVRTISLAGNTTITATYGRAPVASFTFSPAEPVVDDTVTFNASASEDPDGTIVNYAWEFGDGDSDTGVIVEHAYTAAGNYTVTLTVTDNDGLTHTITKTITVKEAPSPGPPLELYLIVAGVIGVIIIAIAVYYLKIMKPKQP